MARSSAALATAETEIPAVVTRSPARQRLADAIGHLATLEGEIQEAAAARAAAEEEQHAAFAAKCDAEEALRQARPREALTPGSANGAFWGGTHGTEAEFERARRAAERPPLTIADAKAALERATDAYDSAKRAAQHHGDRERQASDRLRWKRGDIGGAIRHVVRDDPAMLALANECRRLQTRAEAARQAFSDILQGDVIQPGSPFYGWDRVADARTSPEAFADWSVSREWGAAIESLASDPDVPLPMPA